MCPLSSWDDFQKHIPALHWHQIQNPPLRDSHLSPEIARKWSRGLHIWKRSFLASEQLEWAELKVCPWDGWGLKPLGHAFCTGSWRPELPSSMAVTLWGCPEPVCPPLLLKILLPAFGLQTTVIHQFSPQVPKRPRSQPLSVLNQPSSHMLLAWLPCLRDLHLGGWLGAAKSELLGTSP